MKTTHLTAHGIKVDTDEGRYCLVIETQYGEDDEMLLQIDIHDEVLEFYAAVQREIRPYVLEAESARLSLPSAGPDDDLGYALDDPKHPTYFDRMVD